MSIGHIFAHQDLRIRCYRSFNTALDDEHLLWPSGTVARALVSEQSKGRICTKDLPGVRHARFDELFRSMWFEMPFQYVESVVESKRPRTCSQSSMVVCFLWPYLFLSLSLSLALFWLFAFVCLDRGSIGTFLKAHNKFHPADLGFAGAK